MEYVHTSWTLCWSSDTDAAAAAAATDGRAVKDGFFAFLVRTMVARLVTWRGDLYFTNRED